MILYKTAWFVIISFPGYKGSVESLAWKLNSTNYFGKKL